MFCGMIGEETQSVLTIVALLIPATFYAMGLMEGKKGHAMFLLGMLFHILSLALRGVTLGSIPLTEKHDTISFMALVMALSYLLISRREEMKGLGIFVLPMISIFLLVASKHIPINTISPFLKTPWFFVHIFLYFASYAFFGIASCMGILFLVHHNGESETLQYKWIVSGWILYSLSLVAGSVWFFISYGTYWLWTSRELWSTLTWFFYGLYLHARLMKGFRGRPVSAIGTAGFLVALFTYFGVGTIIPSPPTQF